MLVLKYVYYLAIISNSNNVRYSYMQYSVCYTNWLSELLSNGQTYKTHIPILCQRLTPFCIYQYNFMLTIVYCIILRPVKRRKTVKISEMKI